MAAMVVAAVTDVVAKAPSSVGMAAAKAVVVMVVGTGGSRE